MGLLQQETFICIDCESTGLEVEKDRIIEIAIAKFNFEGIIESFETLIDPEMTIPEESIKIHHISDELVKGKPKIKEELPKLLKMANSYPIVGHGISFDINLITNEAKRNQVPCCIAENTTIDTLRLARLYGESPINSLENLRKHFNIEEETAHRAMSDVLVNIAVFKQLSKSFSTLEKLLERLKKPILLRTMPLGKHKGRKFSEIPLEYLLWAAKKDFDMDLAFSIQTELKNRRHKESFQKASNPFSSLT